MQVNAKLFWLSVLLAAAASAEGSAQAPGSEFRDCADCPRMLVLPAGSIRIGDLSGDGESNEQPVRAVTIARAFALGKYEVTFAEWDACVRDGGCDLRPYDEGWGRDDRPVIYVSWNDAKQYLGWLSRKTGRDYRLPSEAEWEYAARAGSTTAFHFGDRISPAQANYNGTYDYVVGREWWSLAKANGLYREQTVAVGSFPANAFGLHDVHGNVWEWVEDCWNDDYAGAPKDGNAWTTGDCAQHAKRGGSWFTVPWAARAAARVGNGAGEQRSDIGFRVARSFWPLHDAARAGDLGLVQELFRGTNAEVAKLAEEKDGKGLTPLHHVTLYVNEKRTKEAEETAADILNYIGVGESCEIENNKGATPLHYAAAMGQPKLIYFFSVCVRDIDPRDKNGATPLHYAAAYNLIRTLNMWEDSWRWAETVYALLASEADVNAKDKDGGTVLHYLMQAMEPRQPIDVVLDLFLSVGADIDARNKDGWTPLHIATSNLFRPDYVELLLDRGADINVRDNKGRTPLHHAAYRLRPGVVKTLLDRGADKTIKDESGNTARDGVKIRDKKGLEKNKQEILRLLE